MKEPDTNLVKNLIKKHFPNVSITKLSRITEGYTHSMYDCECFSDEKKFNIIVRIGYNRDPTYTIAKEIWVMKQYKKQGIPVPKIHGFDTTFSQHDFEYLIMEKLKGQPLDKVWDNLTQRDKNQIAFKIGKFLSTMHNVNLDDFGLIGKEGLIPENEFSFRSTVKHSKVFLCKEIILKYAMYDFSGLLATDLITPEQSSMITKHIHSKINMVDEADSVLTHTDFALQHLFVDKVNEEWEIIGICDFEFARAYPREYDFIKLHRDGLLDDSELKENLLNGYGRNKLNKNFDEIVALYKFTRDVGFARFLARKGEFEFSKKILKKVIDSIK